MESKLMSLKLDWTFKEIMQNQKARNGFIAAVLKISVKEIISSKILSTFLRKDYKDDKLGILDVRVELNGNIEIDIEMQVVAFKEWAERSLFYTSKMYIEQIKSGEEYDVLKKCINISILDFNYLNEDSFYNSYHIRNDKSNELYTDKMGFYIIELPKIPKEIETIDDLLLWAKFINTENEEELKMLATKNESIEVAYGELQRISQDEEKRLEYESRQKSIRDYNSLIKQYKQEGIEIGIEKGIKKGIEKGIKKGIEKGEYKKAIETAKNFLSLGLKVDMVAQGTGLTIEQVEVISNSTTS